MPCACRARCPRTVPLCACLLLAPEDFPVDGKAVGTWRRRCCRGCALRARGIQVNAITRPLAAAGDIQSCPRGVKRGQRTNSAGPLPNLTPRGVLKRASNGENSSSRTTKPEPLYRFSPRVADTTVRKKKRQEADQDDQAPPQVGPGHAARRPPRHTYAIRHRMLQEPCRVAASVCPANLAKRLLQAQHAPARPSSPDCAPSLRDPADAPSCTACTPDTPVMYLMSNQPCARPGDDRRCGRRPERDERAGRPRVGLRAARRSRAEGSTLTLPAPSPSEPPHTLLPISSSHALSLCKPHLI